MQKTEAAQDVNRLNQTKEENMVVAEGPNEYILYAHNDQGDSAGQFAAHWGNETFSPLKPRASMILVAEPMITAGGIGTSIQQLMIMGTLSPSEGSTGNIETKLIDACLSPVTIMYRFFLHRLPA